MNKTPISILQEIAVQRKYSLPEYETVSCADMPGPRFKCTVKVGTITTCGYASTKKEAKQNCAQKALESMGMTVVNSPQHQLCSNISKSISQNGPFVNYVGILNEHAAAHRQQYARYSDNILATNGEFVTQCSFMAWITEGFGPNKKDAKQIAAKKMLDILKKQDLSIYNNEEMLQPDKKEKIDKLNEEIIKAFSELSIPNHKANTTVTNFVPIPNLAKTVCSMEQFSCELKKYGVKYSIHTFQKDPWIMMLKVTDTYCTVMGTGLTKDEAIMDLFETARLMFSIGFSLNVGL